MPEPVSTWNFGVAITKSLLETFKKIHFHEIKHIEGRCSFT